MKTRQGIEGSASPLVEILSSGFSQLTQIKIGKYQECRPYNIEDMADQFYNKIIVGSQGNGSKYFQGFLGKEYTEWVTLPF